MIPLQIANDTVGHSGQIVSISSTRCKIYISTPLIATVILNTELDASHVLLSLRFETLSNINV